MRRTVCSAVCCAVLQFFSFVLPLHRPLYQLAYCMSRLLCPYIDAVWLDRVQEKLSSMLMRLDQLAPTAFMPIRCPPSAPDGPTWGGIKPTMICKDNRSRTVAEGIYRGFFGPFVDVGEGEDEVR